MRRSRKWLSLSLATLVIPLLLPSPSNAGTYHWSTGSWLGAGAVNYDLNSFYLVGVYCHELDAAQTRQIGAGSVDIGSFIYNATDSFHSYGGGNYIRGACHNPHSVGYSFNAHDNY